MRLHHLALRVSDCERALAFYGDLYVGDLGGHRVGLSSYPLP